MKPGVTVDSKKTLEHLDDIGDLVSGTNPSIVIRASKELDKELNRAFRQKTNPEGTTWKRREKDYPWEFMNRTGTLFGALTTGYGVKTKDKRLKIYGKVRDASYLGTYTRGAGHKPMVMVAGAVQFGRKRARSAEGWRSRTRRGVTTTRWHSGGSKLKKPASTGVVPPRKFFGMGQMAKFRVKRFAQREIKKAHD